MIRIMDETDPNRRTFVIDDLNSITRRYFNEEAVYQAVSQLLAARIADEVYKNNDFGKNLVKKLQVKFESDMTKGDLGSLVAKTIAIELTKRLIKEKK